MKKLLLFLIISSLLIGCAYASTSVNDFKVDDKLYNSTFNESDGIMYFDDANSSGVCILKYSDTNDNDDDDNDDAVDDIVQDDGKDYLEVDDDYKLDKKSDNTANFTDTENNEQGVVEVIEVDGEKFVIVFWSKNADDQKELASQLNDFNKDNDVKPVAF